MDLVRTDMNCTNCTKNFIAQLDMSLDGDHTIECPYCGHWHFRVVRDGKVTEDRSISNGNQRQPSANDPNRKSWKATSEPKFTSKGSAFIRDAWLNRSDLQL